MYPQEERPAVCHEDHRQIETAANAKAWSPSPFPDAANGVGHTSLPGRSDGRGCRVCSWKCVCALCECLFFNRRVEVPCCHWWIQSPPDEAVCGILRNESICVLLLAHSGRLGPWGGAVPLNPTLSGPSLTSCDDETSAMQVIDVGYWPHGSHHPCTMLYTFWTGGCQGHGLNSKPRRTPERE